MTRLSTILPHTDTKWNFPKSVKPISINVSSEDLTRNITFYSGFSPPYDSNVKLTTFLNNVDKSAKDFDVAIGGPLNKATREIITDKELLETYEKAALSKNGGIKHDQDKPPLHLLSGIADKATAEVLAFGAKKYAAHNWRKGMKWSRLLRAAKGHIQDFIDGEDKDPESGLSHLSHAACCIMFLQEYEKTHPNLDDRYKKEE